MHYYKRDPAKYIAHTLHLTLAEDGLYTRLLDWMYLHAKPLPTEVKLVAKCARSPRQVGLTKTILHEFFELKDDGWHHKHVMQDIDKYNELIEKRAEAGRKGGQKKPSKRQANASQPEPEPEPELNNSNNPNGLLRVATADSAPENPDPKPARKSIKYEPRDLQGATQIFERIQQANPHVKEPDLEVWANTLRLMREQDKLTYEQIWQTFDWANRDARFWSNTILSITGLRKHFATIQSQRLRQTKPSNDVLDDFLKRHSGGTPQ